MPVLVGDDPNISCTLGGSSTRGRTVGSATAGASRVEEEGWGGGGGIMKRGLEGGVGMADFPHEFL